MAPSRNSKAAAKNKPGTRSKAKTVKPSNAKKAKSGKGSANGPRRRPRPSVRVYRDILEREPARRVAPRSTFEALAVQAEAAAATPAALEASAFTFVAVVSHDGPWELRSLIVNDFQVLDTTQPSSELRIDVPIPAVFGGQLAINWSILAGHLIPGVATFVEPAGQPAVKLADKAPLKKGESWAPLTPSTFP